MRRNRIKMRSPKTHCSPAWTRTRRLRTKVRRLRMLSDSRCSAANSPIKRRSIISPTTKSTSKNQNYNHHSESTKGRKDGVQMSREIRDSTRTTKFHHKLPRCMINEDQKITWRDRSRICRLIRRHVIMTQKLLKDLR